MGLVLDLARTAPIDQAEDLVEECARGQAILLKRITAAAAGELRERKAPTQWGSTEDAAREAGLDMSTEASRLVALKRISRWARGEKWASRPSRGVLRIDMPGFRRWLDLKRGSPA